MGTRPGQYSISAKSKEEDKLKLGEEYKLLSIRTGIPFSRLVFDAMQYYKEQGKLPEVNRG